MMCLTCGRTMVKADLLRYRAPQQPRPMRYYRIQIWLCSHCGRQQIRDYTWPGHLVLRPGIRPTWREASRAHQAT